jgi:ferritin-like metal-binding protein YciE
MTATNYIKWFKAMLKEEKNGVKAYTKLLNSLRKDNPQLSDEISAIVIDEKAHVTMLEEIINCIR